MRQIAILIRLIVVAAPITMGANWPQWRGPSADGISLERTFPPNGAPTRTSPGNAAGWPRHSTPIVWGDRIFLTAQIGDGPYEGRARDFENASVARLTGERDMVRFVVQAFSRRHGHPLWEYKFDADGFMQPVHIKHNMASPSCVTDGELVYAWIGTGQLVALTLDSKEVWKRHLAKEYGPFEILWGHGSSPMIYKNTLILPCDHQDQAYLLSLEKRAVNKSGKLSAVRTAARTRRRSSSPDPRATN